MTHKEYLKRFEKYQKLCYNITKAKNQDYSSWNNAFLNFKLVEEVGIATTEQWFLTRMMDKITRINNLLNKEASVKDETIQDTLLDLANYSLLLLIYLDEKQTPEYNLDEDVRICQWKV